MFIGPVYTLHNGNSGTSPTTAITILQLKPGANGPAEILSAKITTSDLVTSTQIAAALQRKSAAATVTAASAGTTLVKKNPASPTADATLGTSATGITASGEGTPTDYVYREGFNILSGFRYNPLPEEREMVPSAGFIGVTLTKTPPGSTTFWAELTFRELRAA